MRVPKIDWKRWRCDLFGCTSNEHGYCERCGVDIYEGFFDRGQLDWFFAWPWKIRHLLTVIPKCAHCGKRYRSWRKGADSWVCSQKCGDEWIPF
ncbi:hypothetical protein SAMN05444166_4231 [Singulisphaera sp. GP187]|nr:hypothetical protein SAMN05444166_4231 [Singulisphaera sp. GP187]